MHMFPRNSCLVLVALAALLVPGSRASAVVSALKPSPATHPRATVHPPQTQPKPGWPAPFVTGNPPLETLSPTLKIAQTPIEDEENNDETRPWVLAEMVRVLIRSGQTDRALQLVRSVPQEILEKNSLAYTIEWLLDSSRISEILEIVQHLEASEQVQVLLNIASRLSAKDADNSLIGKLQAEALAVAQALPDSQQNAGASAIAMYALNKTEDNADQSQQVFQWIQTIENDEIKLEVLRTIGIFLASTDRIPRILELVEFLETDRERASMLLPIVSGPVEIGQIDRVWQVIQSLETLNDQDASYLNQLVNHLVEVGEFSKALELVQRVENVDRKAKTLHQISRQAMAAGKTELAEQTRAEVLALIPAIEDVCCRASLRADISLDLAKSGQVTEGLALARTVDLDGFKVTALEDIATYLVEVGNRQLAKQVRAEALVVARSISESSERFKALREIADRLETEGQLKLARKLRAETVDDLGALADDGEKANAIATLIRSSLVEDETLWPQTYAQALEIVQTMTREKDKSESLARLVHLVNNADQYQQLLQITQTLTNRQWQAYSLIALASSQFAQQQPEHRQAIVARLLDIVPELEINEDSAAMSIRLANLLYESGYKAQAMQVLQNAPEGHANAAAFFESIYTLASTGEIDRAVQLAEAFPEETARQRAFATIALMLLDAQQYEQALLMLGRLSDRWLAAGVLTHIADRHLDDGETAKADDFLNRALALVEQ